jgi:hypothetical protein
MAGIKADVIQVGQRTVRVVTLGPHTGLRELRGAVLEVMLWLDQHTDLHAVMTIAIGRLTEKRIVTEIDAVSRITAPAILQRLHASVLREPPADPCAALDPWLRTPELAAAIRRNRWTHHGPARPAFPQVLMVLVQDLLGGVPVRTRHELERITDLSYLAIARALTEIGSLVDHGYRALRLRDFPRDAWDRMLANRSAWRHSQSYCVGTGLAFKPERVIRQTRELDRQDLAFGGVIAAQSYRPIDLIGIPRLDISMHAPVGMMDLSWVTEVAPELRPSTAGEAPHLVVHAVRRTDPLFTTRSEGSIADRAEVLLDLHELRLEAQAATFVQDALAERTHG